MRVAWWIARTLLRAAWIGVMVLVPLFGFWLASSLAAYSNASQWLALLVGLALFPILPVGWDLIFLWRRSRAKVQQRPILTRLDRLVLRTLLINGVFLAGMLWAAKGTAFHAIAQRGDWMCDGFDGPVASTFRGWLLALADRFESKPPATHYGHSDVLPDIEPPKTSAGWPLAPAIDPKIANMPEMATIEAAGAYLTAQFPDTKTRVKAVHDVVVLRLSYDYDALKKILGGQYDVPSQEAAAVFARRTAVCEGYARLMVALGKASNLEIAYVTGYIRDVQRRAASGNDATVKASLQGYGHAWNAVKLDGEWQLIDATWDDPTGGEPRTTYLFTPPKLFAYDHLPEDPKWQLLATPLSAGDFARQPMLSPEIGELGITLAEPTRAQVSVSGEVTLVLDNPYRAEIDAEYKLDDHDPKSATHKCDIADPHATHVTVTCKLDTGEYEVRLFAASATHGREYSLSYIGSILANSH